MRRTMLFFPGNSPNMLLNAGYLGSDSLILDLEDAVAITEKDSARILVRNAITSLEYEKEIIVRINPVGTPFWEKDLETIIPVKPHMIMPTKVGSAEDVKIVSAKIAEIEAKCGIEVGSTKLIPLIETAMGILTPTVASRHGQCGASPLPDLRAVPDIETATGNAENLRCRIYVRNRNKKDLPIGKVFFLSCVADQQDSASARKPGTCSIECIAAAGARTSVCSSLCPVGNAGRSSGTAAVFAARRAVSRDIICPVFNTAATAAWPKTCVRK